MNVHDMVRAKLTEIGADGLCYPEHECGCALDRLFPCGHANEDCVAARKKMCTDCDNTECKYRDTGNPDLGWCYVPINSERKEGE